MRNQRIFSAIVMAVLALGAVVARSQSWAEKPPDKWTKKDCEKLLRDSPWAKSWERTSGSGSRATPVRTTYVAQLWSVRLVRQAVVRMAQLDAGYASLSAAEKKAQEAEGARFVGAEFPDTVVVQVLFGTNSESGERDVRQKWQTLSLAALKDVTILTSPRGRVALAGFTAPVGLQNEFQFVFPRLLNGKLLIEPGDEFLRLEFVNPARGILPEQHVVIEFRPAEMVREGKLLL